jgi:hypothetical protein
MTRCGRVAINIARLPELLGRSGNAGNYAGKVVLAEHQCPAAYSPHGPPKKFPAAISCATRRRDRRHAGEGADR